MATMTPAKRKEMQDAIFKFFKMIDPSGMNEKFYRDRFEGMSDAEFGRWFKGFFADPKAYLQLHTVDYDAPINMDALNKTSKAFNIPLFEYIYLPNITMDKENIVRTPLPVPSIFLNIKRTQQTVMHKNGLSTNIHTRSPITNQLVGDDKNGRSSDLENTMLISMGLTNCLRELNGPRSDDMAMKNQMQRDISIKGYYRIDESESNVENKTTLNTVNVYLLSMGLSSDLVTTGLMTKNTLKGEI